MICPVDLVQMYQKDKIGGGVSEDSLYQTWELKECPVCGRVVKESYEAKVLTAEEVREYEA